MSYNEENKLVQNAAEFIDTMGEKGKTEAEELLAKRISSSAAAARADSTNAAELSTEAINKYSEIMQKDKSLMAIKVSNTSSVYSGPGEDESLQADKLDAERYGSVCNKDGKIIASYDPSGWSSVPSRTEEPFDVERKNPNYGAYEKVLEDMNKTFKNILSSRA